MSDHESNKTARKRYRRRMISLIILEVFFLALTLAMTLCYAVVQRKWSLVETINFVEGEIEANVLESEAVAIQEKYTTIMFFGVDARDNTSLVVDANADTDIICCINNETKEIRLVSILRDTFLETSSGKHGKLTAHYAAYGVKEALNTINRDFDLMIGNYVTVNWKAVADTIDLMGGMDIEMSAAEGKAINQFIWEVIDATGIQSHKVSETGGMYHLDGVQTVTYARIR
ncbi:MAG: LCP family protein, partial [Lachnospiraceae bacterium]|nr:LCP family protein [Lachnospiraceae bacterium]